MSASEPARPLSPEEVALALRVMSDPEARERAWDAVRRTYLNPELWRELGQAVAQTYLNPDTWRLAWDAVRRTYLDPELWREAAQALARVYSPENLRQLATEVTRQYDADALQDLLQPRDAEAVAEAARDFEGEVGQAEDAGPQYHDPVPLGSWLASRSTQAQVALLLAGLAVLDRASILFQDATGTELPEGVRNATALVFAFATFLLLWLDSQSRPPED